MRRHTYRYSTKKVDFGSPTWNCIAAHLKAKDIYWFLTDPYDHEVIAVMVSSYDVERFCKIANDEHSGEFQNRELPDRIFR